ncbi:MAG TPA: hypothetical protein VMT20_12050 [Terriglobia bacterium]|nr:hypothetical protein [Terriglobia bacterium]
MRIGKHGLLDHLRLLAPLFGFIAAVWALRMVVFAAGAPRFSVELRVISVTVAGGLSVLLAVLMIHRRNFGGYASVVAAVFLLSCWEQVLISAAIIFTALTGIANVYTGPDLAFVPGMWRHAAGHLTFGIGFSAILGSAMACILFWMLRRADSHGTAGAHPHALGGKR